MRRVLPAFVGPLLLVALFATRSAHATEVGSSRNFGIGFGIGEPTGIVAKAFLGNGNAIDMGLSFYRGWGRCHYNDRWEYCRGHSSVGLSLDYLWQMNLVRSTVKLDWHIGVGGRIWFWSDDGPNDRYDDFALGARMPLGLDLTFNNPSFLEVFFELSPILYLVPGTDFGIEPLIGVRFYF